MSVQAIQGISSLPVDTIGQTQGTSTAEASSFKDLVNDYLSETNDVQLEAGEAIQKMAAGDVENIHDVMIAVEKGRLSLELVMEIRSKLLDAYRELMRMQM